MCVNDWLPEMSFNWGVVRKMAPKRHFFFALDIIRKACFPIVFLSPTGRIEQDSGADPSNIGIFHEITENMYQ